MGYIAAADPSSKTPRVFMNPTDLTIALEQLKFIPLRPDGTPFIVNFLVDEGGYLLDGAPLNVWFDGAWYEGQQEVGRKYWGSNGVPLPSQSILSLPVVPMPQAVAETYQAFKSAQGGGLLSNPVLLLAAAAAGLWLLSGAGKGSRTLKDDDY